MTKMSKERAEPKALDAADAEWIDLCRRTNDPKLSWIEAQLEAREIPSQRAGFSWHAPILQVSVEDFLLAHEILAMPVGKLEFGDYGEITIDDLPDEHPYFTEWAMASGRAFAPREAQTSSLAPLMVKDTLYAGLSYEDVDIPQVGVIRMVDVESRMLSAIGKLDPYEPASDGPKNYLFARFKGGSDIYRYENTTVAHFAELLRRQRAGESLGGYFDATFKKHPVLFPYERWDEALEKWVWIDPTAKKARRRKVTAGQEEAAVVLPKAKGGLAEGVAEHVEQPVAHTSLTEGSEFDDVF